MDKYLFADGTNGVKEVQSREELNALIQASPRPEKIKIWAFNTHEWLSYADFTRLTPRKFKKEVVAEVVIAEISPARIKGRQWLKKFMLFSVSGVALFFIYNFTHINWRKASSLNISAERPSNVPAIDADSLIQVLELTRGQKLDRVTKTNLRIRNTWPERILLQLNADRDTSSIGTKYYNIELSIDNTTGYNIDNAIVKLTTWKDHQENSTDTFHFSNISYALAAKRKTGTVIKADSISVSFENIRAKSFNFCYSADKKSNYGSAIDRWFCRE